MSNNDDEIMSKLFELVKSEHLELKKKKLSKRKRTYTPEQRKIMLDNLRRGRQRKAELKIERQKKLSEKHNVEYVEEKIEKKAKKSIKTKQIKTQDICNDENKIENTKETPIKVDKVKIEKKIEQKIEPPKRIRMSINDNSFF